MRLLFLVLLICIWSIPVFATEKDVQKCICKGLKQEVILPSGARADCVSKEFAIEIDHSDKWAESIGQSLLYAGELNLTPMIYLYCEKDTPIDTCITHINRMAMAIAYHHLPIHFRVWLEDDALRACNN